jgi:hypothetical protein
VTGTELPHTYRELTTTHTELPYTYRELTVTHKELNTGLLLILVSAALLMTATPSWDTEHRGVVTAGGRSLKTGPIGCPETSVMNYHYALRNAQEKHRIPVYYYLLNPGSYPMCTMVSFMGVKRQGREAGHSPSSGGYERGEIAPFALT